MLDSLAQVLLVLVLQASSLDGAPSLLNVSDPEVKIAIEAVVKNPGEKWAVEVVSKLCHVSRATLVRRFRQHTSEFVTWGACDARGGTAASRLQDASSGQRVSEAVGYSSISAFSRAFQSQPSDRRLAASPEKHVTDEDFCREQVSAECSASKSSRWPYARAPPTRRKKGPPPPVCGAAGSPCV